MNCSGLRFFSVVNESRVGDRIATRNPNRSVSRAIAVRIPSSAPKQNKTNRFDCGAPDHGNVARLWGTSRTRCSPYLKYGSSIHSETCCAAEWNSRLILVLHSTTLFLFLFLVLLFHAGCSVGALLIFVFSRSKTLRRNVFLLTGPSFSGKTALFYKVRAIGFANVSVQL